MKHSLLLVLITSILCLILTSAVVLAGSMDNARFALHAKPFVTPTKSLSLCPQDGVASYDPNYQNLGCENYSVTAPVLVSPGPYVYLMVVRGGTVGINGASCGIDYNPDPAQGVDNDFIDWTSCTDGLQFPNDGGHGEWPQPKGGLRITWATCQTQTISYTGVHAVVGFFYTYAYSEDVFRVTPNNNLQSGPELVVSDCGGSETDLLKITAPQYQCYLSGAVHFGGNGFEGISPCWDFIDPCPTSAASTSWGKIKSRYLIKDN